MRRPTFHLLSAAFTLAVAGCKKEPLPESPPPVPVPETPASATATATTASSMRPGQRCNGSLVANLAPREPVDYLALRLDYYPQGKHEIVVAGSRGDACKGANDPSTCKTALAQVKADKGGEYLVYTRGDEIKTVNGGATGPFLIPIESAEEAAVTLVYTLAADTSAASVLPSCDPNEYRATADGWQTTHTSRSFCEEKTDTTYAISKAGMVKVLKTDHTPPKPGCHPPQRGRKPEGLALAPRADGATLGGYFAEAAEMEAASVPAFERLEAELCAMGAPSSLRRRARRAADDEARHATAMTALAMRFGGTPRPFALEGTATRALLDMAIENVVEGCVFETWAALLATFQAEHAGDADVRAAMKAIARDETRHAALAWDVGAFLETQLDSAERQRVRDARETAILRLEATLAGEVTDELRVTAGVPTAADARALFASFAQLAQRPLHAQA